MMKNRKIIIIVTILTVLMMGFQTAFVSAESLSEIRQQIKEKEAALEKGRTEEQSLASQVTAMEEQLAKLDVAIAEGEDELKKLEKEVLEAEEKVEKQTDDLNSRLRNMYKTSSVGYLDVLLESGSFSEFLTNLELVKKIYNNDQEILKELEDAHKTLESKRQEAEELQAELEESRKVTAENKAVIEAKKNEIAASNKKTQQMLDELEADADRITADTPGYSGSDSSYSGGIMAWPSPTCRIITSPFGYRTRPYSGFHNGIDLAMYGSAHGQPIVAANSGTVIRASWYGGYGNCVMIDHGGGYVTLYAHASKLLVRSGQYVSRGEKIALIGNTGNSFGAHLHFEVRINGKRVNPYPTYISP